MDSKTLSKMRPRDDSSVAIREALATVAREREAAISRRDIAGENRKAALRDPAATAKDINTFEQHARNEDIELERIAALAEDLEARLVAAVAAEDAQAKAEAVEAARVAYREAVEAVRMGRKEYPEAAARIARAHAAEKDRVAALGRFRAAVAQSLPPGSPAHAGLFDPGLGHEDLDASFLANVVLPGLPGEPTILGSLPPRAASTPYVQDSAVEVERPNAIKRYVEVTVARGRSISALVVTGQRIVGGVPELVYGSRIYSPGETVEVDESEVKHLIATGYAVDPNASAADAPTVIQDGIDPRKVGMQGWDQGVA